MRKYEVIELANRFKTSPVIAVSLLHKFLETENVSKLSGDDNIPFSSYLSFLQKEHPNISDLFSPSSLPEGSVEATALYNFISQEPQKKSIICNTFLSYRFTTVQTADGAVSSITIQPSNGRIVTTTCNFNWYGEIFPEQSKIESRDTNGQYIETIIEASASTIAFREDGKMVTGTCAFSRLGFRSDSNEIVLRDANGKLIETLVKEPASAIAIRKDGKMITGTCVSNILRGISTGEIVLRNANGSRIKSLVNEPASSIWILDDGNMITTHCEYDDYGAINYDYCQIVLRDADAQFIATLGYEPAATFAMLHNGNVAMCVADFNCNATFNDFSYNKIYIKKPELMLVNSGLPNPPKTLLEAINNILTERDKIACIQFHKGVVKQTADISLLCKLPIDILNEIYAYIITGIRQFEILRRDGFPYATEKQVSVLRPIDMVDKIVARCMFFKQQKITQEIKQIVINDIIDKCAYTTGDKKIF